MRTLALIAIVSSSWLIFAAEPATPKADWENLLVRGDKSPWKKVDANWKFAKSVTLDSGKSNRLIPEGEGEGEVWVNGPTGRVPNLITKKNYQDVEVELEFLLGRNSNSGIKFQAVYEIQLRDTAGNKGPLSGDDCGGIYPRAADKPKYHHLDKGIAPKVNAAKPAGEWQTLTAQFRSPRFNDKGEKIENAKIISAKLNGQLIHENVELQHPTGANWVKKEVANGPFMLQSDHGPTAFRNVKIREVK